MATVSRLMNNNLLLLLSKPALNLRTSNYHPKPLQFYATNNTFSDSKLGTFRRLNSTSRNIEAVKASSPCLKSKSKSQSQSQSVSVLLGSCLLIALMFISSQRPAFASILKSLKILKGCSFCSSGCLLCSHEIMEQMLSGLGIIFLILVPFLSLLIIFTLKYLFVSEICNFTSIFTIQMGLLAGDDLLSDLNLISETLAKSDDDHLTSVLNDMVEVLDLHKSKLIYGYSSGIIVWEGMRLFRNLLFQERKRLDQKRPVNLRNSKTKKRILPNKDRFVVVTLMIACNGLHKLPSISKRRDLDRVLKKIASCNSRKSLEKFNFVYVPEENEGSFTTLQIENNYPHLKLL